MSQVIRVVVADDSAFIRDIIRSYLQSSDQFEVVGMAENGDQAVDLVRTLRPDVVTMDVDMPGVGGLEAVEMIMRGTPTPIVMVSGVSRRAAETTAQAIQLGAVDFILKYVPNARIDPAEMRADLLSKVRMAADVRVVRTLPRRDATNTRSTPPTQNTPVHTARPGNLFANYGSTTSLVLIGASTGGPGAIKRLLTALPTDFDAPIVIVQHIPAPFTHVLAAQFNEQLTFATHVITGGETLQPRHVYIAPGGQHVTMSPSLQLQLQDGPPINGHCPSIDVTMKSIARQFPHTLFGVLLTGMGEDGASGMAFIKNQGGRTFAQDAESCVVNGMPHRAIQLGGVDHVASPEGIADRLSLLARQATSQHASLHRLN